jgi:hypothetical protein
LDDAHLLVRSDIVVDVKADPIGVERDGGVDVSDRQTDHFEFQVHGSPQSCGEYHPLTLFWRALATADAGVVAVPAERDLGRVEVAEPLAVAAGVGSAD